MVNAEQTSDSIILRVSDDGVGIAPQHLDKIFRRFYRVDTSRSRDDQQCNGGYGLGLAFGKWIADVHHVVITAESMQGSGSVFTVIFPIFNKLSQ